MLLLALACTTPEPLPTEVAWTSERPRLDTFTDTVRGQTRARSIVHLHSPWSHDACDNGDGQANAECLADLRKGLCDNGIDYAFVTDHPATAAERDYSELLHLQDGDTDLGIANQMECGTTLLPGIEDATMPVGLERHVPGTVEERDAIYNRNDKEALGIIREAGAVIFQNHPEERSTDRLKELRSRGVAGIEVYQLHAMFAPDIREEFLGLDGWGWVEDIAPFTMPGSTAEPDLLFLAVHQSQQVNEDHWDALLATGPSVGIAGTDAHQNVLNLEVGDGERVDSYRRMLSWFSNWLLVEGDGPEAAKAALAAGRNTLVFEALGTPADVDVWLQTDSGPVEMGGEGGVGTLHVPCFELAEHSPRGVDSPEIDIQVLKDGAAWADGCGKHSLIEPGVYRVEAHITPHHLAPFLGDSPDDFIRPYPWILSNAVRVSEGR